MKHVHCLRHVRRPLVFVTLTACVQPPALPHPTPDVRVMTYNIQAGSGNLDAVAAVVRSSRAEIAALQEVDVHWHARSGFVDQAAELGRRLGMSVRFAPIYVLPRDKKEGPVREYGVAVLSRFPIVGFTNHVITRLSTQSATASPTPMPGFFEAAVDVHGVRVFDTQASDHRPVVVDLRLTSVPDR